MNILFCGGGTGGHIYPGLALARYIDSKNKEANILFVGTSKGLENKIVPEAGYNLEVMPVKTLSNSSFKEKPLLVKDLLRSVSQAFRIIKKFKPHLVVGTGGYAAGPMVLAARIKRIPVIIHEQNVIPGKTNRVLAPWVQKVCITFKESEKFFRSSKVELTGNPRAGEVISISREKGYMNLKITETGEKVILLFGGSQGALKINNVAVEFIKKNRLPVNSRLIFITGSLYYEKIIKELKDADLSRVIVKPYLEDMPSVFAVADLVVCRAGATALAELTACGLPAILIPSPNVAYNHQYFNALILKEAGAATIISEDVFSEDTLNREIINILNNPEMLDNMSLKSKELGITDASERIYKLILQEISINGDRKNA